jgi:cation transport ATPase
VVEAVSNAIAVVDTSDTMSGMSGDMSTDEKNPFSSSSSMGSEAFFETSSTLIAFVLLGRLLENIAKGKTSEALTKLMSIQPDTAVLLTIDDEGNVTKEETIGANTLQVQTMNTHTYTHTHIHTQHELTPTATCITAAGAAG